MSDAVEAAKKALEEAQVALRAAEAEAAAHAATAGEAVHEAAATPVPAGSTPAGPLSAEQVEAVRAGYAFDGAALELGALVNGSALVDVPVRIPIAMTNRHGLVAGATGTGKTKTLQVLAEQLSANGVPVFAADIKGDLSGIASPGIPSDAVIERADSVGQQWTPAAAPTEFYSLGGSGAGVPIRATVSSFGPLLLSKVLGLNETQESSLGLVFHHADGAGLPLLDLEDLRSVLVHLTGDEGRAELKELGGLSKATAGVILRELITFASTGADRFFGEPEFDTANFLRTDPAGRGIVSLLEVPSVREQPALFTTFLMWLLADLFNDLPEVGDTDKPKLVFFFDEAHLLFRDASKDFLASIVQTVRLIRSKGVGIFFVTQTPKDVPDDVLAQLGSRIQHQLRAHTPNDAKTLRATVSTYPVSGYALGDVLTSLSTGEAIVTVMNESGAPTPVAWTRLRAPQGSMAPTDAAEVERLVAASPLSAEYGTPLDRESAREILAARMTAAAEADAAEEAREEADRLAATRAKERAKAEQDYARAQREWDAAERRTSTRRSTTRRTASRGSRAADPVSDILGSALGTTVVREVLRGVFGTLKRR
ncbi:helicase HerA-like domain-containing protein [Planctomonas psychrotolerans]|uniref:helicase HerA-like domain-containing protein n=1 Tax=Planctomonas psychrotolerans TaxID=2528712 RepID=UPI00123A6515|nr:helicase HerA-like domain-containing protein [Planctomonas psychrotolerans]